VQPSVLWSFAYPCAGIVADFIPNVGMPLDVHA
jgi:hypothetical protein